LWGGIHDECEEFEVLEGCWRGGCGGSVAFIASGLTIEYRTNQIADFWRAGMSGSYWRYLGALGLVALGLGLSLATSGCSRNLFADSDTSTQSRLRYFDGDSATETTASRRKGSEFGFGMPSGGGGQ
jgi:hypothetical protein